VVGWGWDFYGQSTAPNAVNGVSGTATDIAAGRLHSCAIQAGRGKVVCWGSDEYGQATPPKAVNGSRGAATDIAAGLVHSCAIQADTGNVICWGENYYGQAAPPDAVNGISGTASEISVGTDHSCAIQAGTGKVYCWGDDFFEQATPPDAVNGIAGTAIAIAAGHNHSCAIQADTNIAVCWGIDSIGETIVPDAVNGILGTAADITAGTDLSCAIQAETGNVVCWGWNGDGQAEAPDSVNGAWGTASEIESGHRHACAIQTGTSKVICWGYNSDGQATPLGVVNGTAGTAAGIATGGFHSLAIVAAPEPTATPTATPTAPPDTDADGISDSDEINIYGTDPLNPDTDGDGFNDGEEIATGSDPNSGASTPPAAFEASLILHTMANDQAVGTQFPFNQKFFIARPLGARCNPANGGTICGTATLQEGVPLLGSGTISLYRGVSPPSFSLPNYGLHVGTEGSLPQHTPYNYIWTYGFAYNRHYRDGFGPGFGPGKRTVTFPGNSGPGARVAITPGANQFGGTMRILGAIGARRSHEYKNRLFGNPIESEALLSFTVLGSECTVTCYATGAQSKFKTYQYQTAMGKATTAYITSLGLPWTTGEVSITATGGPFPTLFRRNGYDNRTAKGFGTIQMVAPQLVRWEFPNREAPWDRHTGAIGVLRVKFVPEPSGWGMLVAGIVILALFYRQQNRCSATDRLRPKSSYPERNSP
jgi:hypothetical protein